MITVSGAYLESVREPKMYINLNGGNYYSVCKISHLDFEKHFRIMLKIDSAD